MCRWGLMRRSVLVAFVLLAGCVDDAPADPGPTCGADCAPMPSAVGTMRLEGCRQARFVVELAREVYALPPGFENNATLTSPQRLGGALTRCEAVRAGNDTEEDRSYAFLAVLVKPAGNVTANGHALDLEVITDSALLANAFQKGGFTVLNGSVTISDSPARRNAAATGDVEYTLDATLVPNQDGLAIEAALAHHSMEGHYVEERACNYYSGTALVQLSATRGELTRAMQPVGPLVGQSSQAVRCEIRLTFSDQA